MARRKPERRLIKERSRENQNRRLSGTIPSLADLAKLADAACYECYSKHKAHPTAYKLKPYEGTDEDRTFCDAHADFKPADHVRIPLLLKRGIMAGLCGELSDDGVPRMLWTVDDTGWIFELPLTNAGIPQYHGYPMLPSDSFARIVLERFAYAASTENIRNALDEGARAARVAAEERYK